MKGILIFDIQERDGKKIPQKAISNLKDKLNEFAEDFWERLFIENPNYNEEEAKLSNDKDKEYDEAEELDIELTNARFKLAQKGFGLTIN